MKLALYDTNCLSRGDQINKIVFFIRQTTFILSMLLGLPCAWAGSPPEPSTLPAKLIRIEADLDQNLKFLVEATRISKNPKTRAFGLESLQTVSLGIAALFFSDDFYDGRDTPTENRRLIQRLASDFEEKFRKHQLEFTLDTVDALILAFKNFESQIDEDSKLPESERRFKPKPTQWISALSFGVGSTILGEASYRLAKRLGTRGRVMWKSYGQGENLSPIREMFSRTSQILKRMKNFRKLKASRLKADACKDRISGLIYEGKNALKFLSKRALIASGVTLGSYAGYFEDFETYDASEDIVGSEILVFLKKIRKDFE